MALSVAPVELATRPILHLGHLQSNLLNSLLVSHGLHLVLKPGNRKLNAQPSLGLTLKPVALTHELLLHTTLFQHACGLWASASWVSSTWAPHLGTLAQNTHSCQPGLPLELEDHTSEAAQFV